MDVIWCLCFCLTYFTQYDNLCAWLLSHVWLFVTLWTVACRLLCPWGFSRQEYWSGLPCPPPGDLPNPGIEPRSPTLQVDSLPSEPPEKPISSPIYIAANGIILFFLMAAWYFILYAYHIFFVCSFDNGHLGCFHVLAIVNSAAVNIGARVSVWTMFFSVYVPRSGISESYGSCIFSFLKNLHPWFFLYEDLLHHLGKEQGFRRLATPCIPSEAPNRVLYGVTSPVSPCAGSRPAHPSARRLSFFTCFRLSWFPHLDNDFKSSPLSPNLILPHYPAVRFVALIGACRDKVSPISFAFILCNFRLPEKSWE